MFLFGGQFKYENGDLSTLDKWQSCYGIQYEYSGQLLDNIGNTIQFQLHDRNNLQNDSNWNSDINTSINVIVNDNEQEYFIRTNEAPDLDGNNFCGLYKSSKSNTYIAIGSWVCGVENNESFGKFIGVNKRYINSTSLKNYYGTENSFQVQKYQQITRLRFSNDRSYGYDECTILGKTYDLQKTKYLVHWNVQGYEQPYICNRYFILEDNVNPLNVRKFWYCDIPGSSQSYSSPAGFFRRNDIC